jgi:hypothetical protein
LPSRNGCQYFLNAASAESVESAALQKQAYMTRDESDLIAVNWFSGEDSRGKARMPPWKTLTVEGDPSRNCAQSLP